ncbi:MAG: Chemotaxis protein methyltransferase CheR [Betaproteobacteria bacterium]|nr:Chemotaxis protein methyltransferase CheR [Betaproteobacteria bacterium]
MAETLGGDAADKEDTGAGAPAQAVASGEAFVAAVPAPPGSEARAAEEIAAARFANDQRADAARARDPLAVDPQLTDARAPRTYSIRRALVFIVLAALLPMGLFSGVLFYFLWQNQQALRDQEQLARVRTMAALVQSEINSSTRRLELLTHSSYLARNDMAGFYNQVQGLLPDNPDWSNLLLISREAQVFNARLPYGAPLPRLGDLPYQRQAFDTGKPVASDLFMARTRPVETLDVAVPVLRNGKAAYLLIAALKREHLSDVLRNMNTTDGVAAVYDRNLRFIARTRDQELYFGQRPGPQLAASLKAGGEGVTRAVNQEGVASYTAWTQLDNGWWIAAGYPAEESDRALVRYISLLGLAWLAMILLGLVMARLLWRRIGDSIDATAEVAARRAAGERVPFPATSFAELVGLSRAVDRLFARESAARAQAETANRTKDEFLAMLGHELRNPIGAISNAVYILEHDERAARREAAGVNGASGVSGLSGFAGLNGLSGLSSQGAPGGHQGAAAPGGHQSAAAPGGHQGAAAPGGHQGAAAPGGLRDPGGAMQQPGAVPGMGGAGRSSDTATGHSITGRYTTRIPAPPPRPDGRKLALDVISRQSSVLKRMIDDLLDLSKVLTGKVSLELRPIELSLSVRHAMEGLAAAGRTDNHKIELHTEEVWINGDPARIEQILTNLVGNAVNHTDAGRGIRISLQRAAARPRFGPGGALEMAVAGEAVLAVADDGVGIAAETLPRVFDLFFQERQQVDRPKSGLGIGLTLVQRLTELHGGEVRAESAGLGHGARFYVTLPAIATPIAPAPAPAAPRAAQRQILLIEDNIDARETMQTLLEMDGHIVEACPDGVSGLARLRAFPADAAIVDVGLPGMDGYQIAREIRKIGFLGMNRKPILLIALTGYGLPEDIRKAEQAGFDAHLVKPADFTKLAALLQDGAGKK